MAYTLFLQIVIVNVCVLLYSVHLLEMYVIYLQICLCFMPTTMDAICRLCGRDRAIPTDRHPIPKEKRRNQILKVLGA